MKKILCLILFSFSLLSKSYANDEINLNWIVPIVTDQSFTTYKKIEKKKLQAWAEKLDAVSKPISSLGFQYAYPMTSRRRQGVFLDLPECGLKCQQEFYSDYQLYSKEKNIVILAIPAHGMYASDEHDNVEFLDNEASKVAVLQNIKWIRHLYSPCTGCDPYLTKPLATCLLAILTKKKNEGGSETPDQVFRQIEVLPHIGFWYVLQINSKKNRITKVIKEKKSYMQEQADDDAAQSLNDN